MQYDLQVYKVFNIHLNVFTTLPLEDTVQVFGICFRPTWQITFNNFVHNTHQTLTFKRMFQSNKLVQHTSNRPVENRE